MIYKDREVYKKGIAERPVDMVYVVITCLCGGEYDTLAGGTEYMSSPPQRDYACNKCGNVLRLYQSEYPHYEYRVRQ